MSTKKKQTKKDFKDFVILFNKTEIENSSLKFDNAILKSELETIKEDLILRVHKHDENRFTMIPEKPLSKKEYRIIKKMLKKCQIQ